MFSIRELWHRTVWLFAACCVAGFLLESAESLISLGYVENRQGLLYGPFTPIYGAGALAMVLFRPVLKGRHQLIIFAAAALIGSTVEYLWAWGTERWFKAIFWDYRGFSLHLDGRVNLLFTLFWGLLGLLLLRYIYPLFARFVSALPRGGRSLVTWTLAILLTGNMALSVFALSRQRARQEVVIASSAFELFLDETYPDHWMKDRFPGMKLLQDEAAPQSP